MKDLWYSIKYVFTLLIIMALIGMVASPIFSIFMIRDATWMQISIYSIVWVLCFIAMIFFEKRWDAL